MLIEGEEESINFVDAFDIPKCSDDNLPDLPQNYLKYVNIQTK